MGKYLRFAMTDFLHGRLLEVVLVVVGMEKRTFPLRLCH